MKYGIIIFMFYANVVNICVSISTYDSFRFVSQNVCYQFFSFISILHTTTVFTRKNVNISFQLNLCINLLY